MQCISLCAWHLLFMNFCQPVHSCIEPSLHGVDLIFMETCFCSFLINCLKFCQFNLFCHVFNLSRVQFVTWCHPRTCGECVILARVCSNEWLPTASTLSPLSLLCKEASVVVSPIYTQNEARMNHPQRIS